MSKKTLAVLGASLFFAACTNPFAMKKVAPAPMPTPEAPVSSSAPAAVSGAMMPSSPSPAEGMMKSEPAGAMKK